MVALQRFEQQYEIEKEFLEHRTELKKRERLKGLEKFIKNRDDLDS
jgi:hypothetical protein